MLALKREKNLQPVLHNGVQHGGTHGKDSGAQREPGSAQGGGTEGTLGVLPPSPALPVHPPPGRHGTRGGCVGLGQHPLPAPTAGTRQAGPGGLPGSSGEGSWERHLSPGGVSPPAEPRRGPGSPSLTKAERSFRLLFWRGDANLQQSEFKKKLKIAVRAREPG